MAVELSSYVDFEASTNGAPVTEAIINSATHGVARNWDAQTSFLTPGSFSHLIISTNAEYDGSVLFSCNGTNFPSGGTFGMRAYMGTNGMFTTTLGALDETISLGFFFRFGGASINSSPRDIGGFHNYLGKYEVLQIYDQPGSPYYHTHSPFGAGVGSNVTFTRDKWYWVSMTYAKTGETFVIRFYDPDDWSYTESQDLSAAGTGAAGAYWIYFGAANYATTGDNTQWIDFDDFVIDTTGEWPLIPDFPPTNTPYWVSVDGAASWGSAQSATPLSGASCASVSTMNANASEGDTVYLRGGVTGAGAGQIALANDGSATNRIVIQSYSNETFIIANRTAAQGPAIALTNRNYITLSGIVASNCQESLTFISCTNILVQNCNFENHKNTATGYPISIRVYSNSQYNVFREVTAGGCGYDSGGNDEGGVVRLGTASIDSDATRYNLFDNCTLYRGGHDVISDYGSFNIFDDCFFYNDDWYGSQPYGNRVYITEDDDTATVPEHGNATFRDCLFQRSGDPPDGDGSVLASVRTRRNRFTRCVFVDGSNGGIGFVNANATENRVAHCTIVNGGVNTPQADTGQKGGITFYSVGGSPQSNAVMNCILYDNITNFAYEGTTDAQTLTNNWLQADGNPSFVSWSTNDLAPSDSNAHDLGLQSSSGAIDNGGYITTANGSGSSTNVLVVYDSFWFTDGSGVASGDSIQFEGSSTAYSVSSIDYSNHTITLSSPASWTDGDGVAFVYSGTAPDMGANEYIQSTIRDSLDALGRPWKIWIGVP